MRSFPCFWPRALALCLCLAGLWLLAGLAVSAAGPVLPPSWSDRPAPAADTRLDPPAAATPSAPEAAEMQAEPSPDPYRPSLLGPWVRIDTSTPLPPVPVWLPSALTPAGLLAGQLSGVDVGTTAPAGVLLGEDLQYTVVVTNTSGQGATVLLYDVLPVATLDDDVFCQPTCGRDWEVISTTIVTPDQYGAPPYTRIITVTHRVLWENLYLPDGASATARFSFPIDGLDDGARLYNRAYVRYELDDHQTGTGMSDQIETVVSVPVPPGGPIGLSQLPVWYSEDYGGTGRLDWGDYDRDGSMDLVVGGSTGATVYHNNDGHLTRLWTSGEYSHDVRWLEIDGDGLLELVTIGYNWWTEEVDNHIYHLADPPDRFEEMEPTALAGTRLLAIEPADVDADDDMDLVAVTYARWTADDCSVRLYSNDGNWFNTPYTCLATVDQDYEKVTESFLSLGDHDNNDAPDLLLDMYDLLNTDPTMPCSYRDMLWLVPNDGGSFTATQPITVDLFTRCNFPVDVSWGDYDRDGDLDLAAAVPALTSPNEDEVRVYTNRLVQGSNTFSLTFVLTQPHDQPPFAVRWSDFDADSFLDLAVGAMPYRIYRNQARPGEWFSQAEFIAPPQDPRRGFALDLAVADYDNDGDVDVATGNPLAASTLYAIFASRLQASLTTIDYWESSSVAWGDANGDGMQDLLFGAGENSVDAELYLNVDGQFDNHVRFSASGFGPHSLAFGDMDADDELEVALGTLAEIQLYQAGEHDLPFWTSPPGLAATSLAWADADDDGDLDLAAATNGPIYLFDNTGTTLRATPIWTSPESADTRSLAWADVDGDNYIDLAAGVYGQPSRVYHNNGDGTFTAVWNTSPHAWSTTGLAWADYDVDGDPDLALGNDGEPNVIYQNDDGVLGAEPVWASAEVSHTTALAWGDWDNDGNPDLAVGNRGESNQVYLNLGSRPERPRLTYLWRSNDANATSGIAWGDVNGDGDLDLAVSAGTHIGLYPNYGILSSHLVRNFVPTAPLPDNQSYLSVKRPGGTAAAYFYSAPDLLSGPDHPTVTVEYTLYDPDGTRGSSGTDFPGDPTAATFFEYSVDGGGTWQPATPGLGSPDPITTTRRLGEPARFVWDALADAAIGDDARFRVSIVALKPDGPVQHVLTRAVSPPFRIRGTTCIWPIHPAIHVSNPWPPIGQDVTFVGTVAQASGILTFTWDFADGGTAQGQLVRHHFDRNGLYTVRLTVTSEPCPVAKILRTYRDVPVGFGWPDLYLPLISKGGGS